MTGIEETNNESDNQLCFDVQTHDIHTVTQRFLLKHIVSYHNVPKSFNLYLHHQPREIPICDIFYLFVAPFRLAMLSNKRHRKLQRCGLNEYSTAPCRFSDSGFRHRHTYCPTTCDSDFVIHMNCDWLSPTSCMNAFSMRCTEGDNWNMNPPLILTCIFLAIYSAILEVHQSNVILRCYRSQLNASVDLEKSEKHPVEEEPIYCEKAIKHI